MIGTIGIAITDITPAGQVRLQGEVWNAVSETGDITKDAEITVVGFKDLRAIVKMK